jgi:RsiW-degrading membrane proteinase PrsW (M82 family)
MTSSYYLQEIAGRFTYNLPPDRSISIGRDPTCEIVFNSDLYGSVSRRHAEIRPQSSAGTAQWEVVDLGGANGVYINDLRILTPQTLQIGDRLKLGDNGPELIFNARPVVQSPPVRVSTVSLSQLLPAFSGDLDLRRQGFLAPGIITVIAVVLMFVSIGSPLFLIIVALYLAMASYYAIYRLCGKSKPWWLLVGTAGLTALILITPIFGILAVIFRRILPGNVNAESGFILSLINNFFGAGLLEELLKAIPVFLALWIGKNLLKSPHRELVGVWEPLDGIILGTASAVGFTLIETLGQYIPNAIERGGEQTGLMLLIPRILGQIAGHAAYSGYVRIQV